jgi:hypothetical protein
MFLAYTNEIVQFHPPRRVQLNLFQGLSDYVVGLSFTRLCCLDCSSLIYISLVINVKLSKGILEAEDFVLLELRIFPAEG